MTDGTRSDWKRIDHERLERFVSQVGLQVGMPDDDARLLAKLLTVNDLRGVTSHGTRLISGYAKLMLTGELNSQPSVRVIRETPVSLLIDGGGGLGYFPAYQGTSAIAQKALDSGIGVLATRNHGHFGAAGIYARIPVEHDLLTFVTSGHQLALRSGMPLFAAGGGSPMAFSVPAEGSPPLVVDFGCMHDLYAGDPHRDEIAQLAPSLVYRSIGLGEISQIWGGLLTGLDLDWSSSLLEDDRDESSSERPGGNVGGKGANQGSLVVCFRIDLFADPTEFKKKVAAYIGRIDELEPIPPSTRSYAAGLLEAAREMENREIGVAISPEHWAVLESTAVDLGIASV